MSPWRPLRRFFTLVDVTRLLVGVRRVFLAGGPPVITSPIPCMTLCPRASFMFLPLMASPASPTPALTTLFPRRLFKNGIAVRNSPRKIDDKPYPRCHLAPPYGTMAAMISYAPKGPRLRSRSFTVQMPRSNGTLFPKLSVISTLAVRNSVQRTGSQSKCVGS